MPIFDCDVVLCIGICQSIFILTHFCDILRYIFTLYLARVVDLMWWACFIWCFSFDFLLLHSILCCAVHFCVFAGRVMFSCDIVRHPVHFSAGALAAYIGTLASIERASATVCVLVMRQFGTRCWWCVGVACVVVHSIIIIIIILFCSIVIPGIDGRRCLLFVLKFNSMVLIIRIVLRVIVNYWYSVVLRKWCSPFPVIDVVSWWWLYYYCCRVDVIRCLVR